MLGRCLITAASNSDLDIIVIVFGADSKNIRNTDSMNLINYAFENFRNIDIKTVLENKYSEYLSYYLPYIEIEKSNAILETYIDKFDYDFYSIPSSEKIYFAEIESYDLVAPISENQVVGKVTLFINNSQVLSTDIRSKKYVKKNTSIDYFKKFFIEYKNLCSCP